MSIEQIKQMHVLQLLHAWFSAAWCLAVCWPTIDSAMCVQGAVAHIPKKWSNVQALFLKTADSVALPIYQMLPSGQQKIGTS